MSIRLFFLVVICAGLSWYFVPNEEIAQSEISDALPPRSTLIEKSWKRDTCLLVYPSGTKREAYEEALRALLATRSRRGPTLRAIPSEALTEPLLQNYPLLYLSTGQDDLPVRTLPDLALQADGLQLGETLVSAPDQVAVFSYLPGTGGQSVHLIYSPTDSSLLQFVQAALSPEWPRFLWQAWGYQLLQAGQVSFQGYFNEDSWEMDQHLHFDFTNLPESLELVKGLSIEQWEGHEVDLRPLATDFAAVKAQIEEDWPTPVDQSTKVILYASVEDKAMRTQRMEVAHCNLDKREVHLVENNFFHGMDWGEQYRPLLRAGLGAPHYEALEQGLALHYRTNIRGQDWRSWVRQLAEAEALVDPQRLAQREWEDYQPLLGLLSAAAWVEYLLDQTDRTAFLDYYRHGNSSASLATQYSSWSQWILAHYPTPTANTRKIPAKRLNGFTLAHEGYRIFNGYGGSQTATSLERLRRLGTNAVAIVPYSYMRNPKRVSRIPVMESAGTENDAAIVHAHFQAQALGQFTLLKPQLWINGAWPGDVDFDTTAEWQEFFSYYRDWALHYALLAQIYQFDAYCIGTELRHTTLKQPEQWRALIKDIRQLYHGPLTYAANWGEECEQLSFWPELDFIGVNNYYPLHRDSVATEQQLAAGAQAIMKRLRRLSENNERPLWLTEVGYRSATSPWLQPHAEAGKRAIDGAAQARCYAALLAAMETEKDWLRGMFWWKWPSHLNHDESNGRGYMPLRKPAAEVVKRYFR